MPVAVQSYDDKRQEMFYSLTPSSEKGVPLYTLVVQPLLDKRGKVRLLLHRGIDRVDPANQEVAESKPLSLDDKDERATFVKEVLRVFPDDSMGWVEDALKYLSLEHKNFLEQEVSKLAEDRSDYILLKGHKPPLHHTPHGYRIEGENSAVLLPISNFTAKILEDIKVEEGGDFTERYFRIQAMRNKKQTTFDIPASEFNNLSWVPTRVGALAHYDAKKNLVAKCIKLESEDSMKEVAAYGHTGRVKLEDGRSVYLHKEGAIVPPGTPAFSGRIYLEGKQANRSFPKSGASEEAVREAVRKSFSLWNLYPQEVSIPLVAGAYRAALGSVDFSIYLVGPTGIGKTSFADMVSRFFGKSLGPKDRLNFESTKFSIEREAYRLKDQIAVLDDYLGSNRHVDIMRFIARVAGNESGRSRMTEADKPPRGLLVMTGEQQPPGVSLNARIFTLHFKDEPGWKDMAKFRKMRALSKDGSLPLAMRSFIESLAPDYEDLKEDFDLIKEGYADQVAPLTNHSRTPGIYADLMLGVQMWLDFAQDIEAITGEEKEAYLQKAVSAVSAAVIVQAPLVGRIEETDQVEIVRFAIKEAIKTGKAYVSGPSSEEVLLGENTPLAKHLGWKIDPKGIYLIPDTLYDVAEQMAIDLSLTIPDSKGSWHEALVQSMAKNNYLISHNLRKKRKSTAIRKVIEDEEKTVLHLNPKFLSE